MWKEEHFDGCPQEKMRLVYTTSRNEKKSQVYTPFTVSKIMFTTQLTIADVGTGGERGSDIVAVVVYCALLMGA